VVPNDRYAQDISDTPDDQHHRDEWTSDSSEDDIERPSRSARKREALARQRLGVRLMQLTAAQLKTMELPEELLEAVLEAQRLRSRAALARQQQYIGRLMRQVDPVPIEQALNAKLSR
jgi:ribosome-associated protein